MAFDFTNVKDFDKHIDCSIPSYDELCSTFVYLAQEYTDRDGSVVDIGCSTGKFLNTLDKVKDISYIGVDVVDIIEYPDIRFIQSDASTYLKQIQYEDNVDVLVSMFALQFFSKRERVTVLNEMKRLSESGTIILISEKYKLPSSVDRITTRAHLQRKRKVFTDTEILDKDRDISSIMRCVEYDVAMNEYNQIGDVVPVWQSYNFAGFVIFPRSI